MMVNFLWGKKQQLWFWISQYIADEFQVLQDAVFTGARPVRWVWLALWLFTVCEKLHPSYLKSRYNSLMNAITKSQKQILKIWIQIA